MHDLWTTFSQFTDQKKSEMVQTVQLELFMNSNTVRSQI